MHNGTREWRYKTTGTQRYKGMRVQGDDGRGWEERWGLGMRYAGCGYMEGKRGVDGGGAGRVWEAAEGSGEGLGSSCGWADLPETTTHGTESDEGQSPFDVTLASQSNGQLVALAKAAGIP